MFRKEFKKTFIASMVLTLVIWVPGVILTFLAWPQAMAFMILGACPLYFGIGVLFADRILRSEHRKKLAQEAIDEQNAAN